MQRRRCGGRAGDAPDQEGLKVDVIALIRSALTKETDGRPFVICIDLNLPTDRERPFEEWVQELGDSALADFQSSSADNRDPFSAIFFTNYSWHWNGEEPAGRAMQVVAIPLFPSVALDGDEVGLLAEAVFQYGDVSPLNDA